MMQTAPVIDLLPARYALRPATLDDAAAVTALLNDCALAYSGEPAATVDEVRGAWQRPGLCLETDVAVVVAPDGRIVAQCTLFDEAPHVRLMAVADVHPEHMGRGLGTALCRWADARGRDAVNQAPPDARVVLAQNRLSTEEAAAALLLAQGYAPVRYSFEMTIEFDGPPPEPVVPAGLAIRPFVRNREERAMVAALHDAFRDHWGNVERPLEDEHAELLHMLDNPMWDPALLFVAVDGDEIAGTAFAQPVTAADPEMGWVAGLGVRRPWRRRGLAHALLQRCFADLYRHGKRKVGLGVDAQSLTGATRLYENAGMHVRRQRCVYQKELRPGRELSTQSLT